MSSLLLAALLLLQSSADESAAVDRSQAVVVQLFIRNDSATCGRATEFADKLALERNGVKFVVRDVLSDRGALADYWRLVKQARIDEPVMPGSAVGESIFVGFESEASYRGKIDELLTIRIFGRDDCPHCRDAKRFLGELAGRLSALRVEEFDVVRDAAARRRMDDLARQNGTRVTGLPLISVAGRIFVGYQTDDTTGRRIEALFPTTDASPAPTQKTSFVPLRPTFIERLSTGMVKLFAVTPGGFNFVVQAQVVASSDDLPPPPPTDAAPVPPDLDVTADVPSESTSTPDGVAEIEVPYFGAIRLRDWGLPLFTLIIGLVDGLNPCAMWVLVFLLSVLVNVRDRARILAIAGTFVIVSGLAYFAFMAAWLNLFLLLGLIRPLQITLGCVAIGIGVLNVKDFVAFKRGISLSIPESAKPGIYDRVRHIVSAKSLSLAVSAAVVLAVLVNTVELLCTAGLPALYSEVLTMQNLPGWKNYAYLALYIAAYMFDDALLLSGFVITLSHRKLQEREGRWLKLVSGLVILALGVIMIVRPNWLHLTR